MEAHKYNCLVVDDEPIARSIIINYINKMPILNLAAESINALNAIDYLKTHSNVHIIFLDINMPHLSGLQLMKIVQPKQPVIFTTAYSGHAVESYELNAVDYLLKPFSFERFTKAIYKAIDIITYAGQKKEEATTDTSPLFYIKSDGKNYPVSINDILYCEAMKNYTKVVLKNEQRLMPLVPLSKFETLLAEAGGVFIRVHRSFLIARSHITTITPNMVTVNKFEIPIGVQFKEDFFKSIGIR